jgi:hypothetical protein
MKRLPDNMTDAEAAIELRRILAKYVGKKLDGDTMLAIRQDIEAFLASQPVPKLDLTEHLDRWRRAAELVEAMKASPRPAPWKAGVDNSADPMMVERMEQIQQNLNHRTPMPEFIKMLNRAVNIDSRTIMGQDIQRALLSNAAIRLEYLYLALDPVPEGPLKEDGKWLMSWRYFNCGRFRDAWAVFKRRAVALYVKD